MPVSISNGIRLKAQPKLLSANCISLHGHGLKYTFVIFQLSHSLLIRRRNDWNLSYPTQCITNTDFGYREHTIYIQLDVRRLAPNYQDIQSERIICVYVNMLSLIIYSLQRHNYSVLLSGTCIVYFFLWYIVLLSLVYCTHLSGIVYSFVWYSVLLCLVYCTHLSDIVYFCLV